ncbi:MAG: hypothetical protein RLZ25_888 [Pseudomonadota bacterium]|jgi:predicted nucleic acid-binding protein
MKMLAVLIFSSTLTGCFTTTLSAPEHHTPVRIMAENEKAAYQNEYKDWYLLGGLLPIYRHNISELISQEKLVEVRVRTEDRFSDGLITFLTDFIVPLFPQTIVVEGNTAEQLKSSDRPISSKRP